MYDRDHIPVVSLAVLGDTEPTWRPDQFGYALWGCELSLRFPSVKLLDFDPAMLEGTPNLFAVLTLLHRDAQETRRHPEERLARKVRRYRALLRQGYRTADIRILLRLMEHLLRLDPERALQARNALRQVEMEELGMDSFVTSFEEIGREEGRAEGLAEGLAKGQITERQHLILRLLNRKLGPLNEQLQAQVAALTPEQMLSLGEALLDFTSQEDLIAWLDQLNDAARA